MNILQENQYVCVIGGSNVDIQGFPSAQLIHKDSNVGKIKISFGGVGRNIAENLVRMGVETHLISVVGDDTYGQKILADARQTGIIMQNTLVIADEQTSVYLSILDQTMDMVLAINQMDIFDKMSVDFIKSKKYVIENAGLCILDTNIPADVLAYLLTTFRNTVFFLDPVSTAKAEKVKDLIGYCHTIKPNRIEAEILSGIKIEKDADLDAAAKILHKKGVIDVFISLGQEGIYFSNDTKSNHIRPPKVKIVNATGAGDAAVAALAFGYLQGKDIEYSAKMAMAAAIIALSHENTINPSMSAESLFNKVQELEK